MGDFLGGVNDFWEDTGSASASFIKSALNGAGQFACTLHYNTPGVIFDVSPFNRGLWKEFCSKSSVGLPVSKPPLFTGGQCAGVSYRVALTVRTTSLNPSGSGFDRTDTADLVGPLTNFTYAYRSDAVGLQGWIETGAGLYKFPQHGGGPGWREVVSVVVTRPDGKPDNCGNEPSPPVAPVVLPPEQRTTNIVVNDVDNSTTNVGVNLSFPSVSVDFRTSFPLVVNMGGLKFYLSLDGWRVGDPVNHDGGNSGVDPSDIKAIGDNVVNIQGSLSQYFAPVNPSLDGNLVLVSPSAGKDSDEQDDVQGAHWLVIDLTKMPDKAQYGGSSPTVYFAGWIEFLKEGRAFPRQQINFERSIFRFPDGADGYAYSFTNGAQGDVAVYVEER